MKSNEVVQDLSKYRIISGDMEVSLFFFSRMYLSFQGKIFSRLLCQSLPIQYYMSISKLKFF